MGIKDINKLLRDKCPEAYQTIPLRTLRGTAIAIDEGVWLFANKSVIYGDVIKQTSSSSLVKEGVDATKIFTKLMNAVEDFIIRFFEEGVTPVWVVDGETREEKACAAGVRRAKPKQVLYEKMTAELEELKILKPLELTAERTSKYRSQVKQAMKVTSKDKEAVRSVIRMMGVHIIQAPYDAEFTASFLSRERKISAVWSVDTDPYALGSNMCILEWDGFSSEGRVIKVFLPAVALHYLEMSHETFLDLCIMLECDFNWRMPGIGQVRAFALMNEHRSIDKARKALPSLPWDKLQYERCREIYSYVPTDIDMESLNLGPDMRHGGDLESSGNVPMIQYVELTQ